MEEINKIVKTVITQMIDKENDWCVDEIYQDIKQNPEKYPYEVRFICREKVVKLLEKGLKIEEEEKEIIECVLAMQHNIELAKGALEYVKDNGAVMNKIKQLEEMSVELMDVVYDGEE